MKWFFFRFANVKLSVILIRLVNPLLHIQLYIHRYGEIARHSSYSDIEKKKPFESKLDIKVLIFTVKSNPTQENPIVLKRSFYVSYLYYVHKSNRSSDKQV